MTDCECGHQTLFTRTGTDGVRCRSCKVFRYYPYTGNGKWETG